MTFSLENFVYFAFGIAVSVLLARRFATKKEIYYHIFSYPVFSRHSLSDVDGFEIKFNGAKVEEVWRHVVFIWNGGNQPIWEADLSSDNPLRIKFSDGADINVEEIIGKSNNFTGKLILKSQDVHLEFPHMDAGQGISFLVLEALRNEDQLRTGPLLEGHVVGLTSPPKMMEPLSKSEAVSEIKFMGGCAVIVCLIAVAVAFFVFDLSVLWPPSKGWFLPVGALLAFGLISDFFGVGKYLRARSLKIPETFDSRGRLLMRLPYARHRRILIEDALIDSELGMVSQSTKHIVEKK